MLRTSLDCNMATIRRNRRTIVTLQEPNRNVDRSNCPISYSYSNYLYFGRRLRFTCCPCPVPAATEPNNKSAWLGLPRG